MAVNAFDPHDAPDLLDVIDLDLDEALGEYFVPVTAYSISSPDDVPHTPPPPEPEDVLAGAHHIDYLNLPGLRTLSAPIKGETQILVRVEQKLPWACPNCGCNTDKFKGNGTRRQFLLDEPRGSLSVP
jgi:hypothetical protein